MGGALGVRGRVESKWSGCSKTILISAEQQINMADKAVVPTAYYKQQSPLGVRLMESGYAGVA